MCEHENARHEEGAKDCYFCDDCNVQIDAEVYKALQGIPSEKTLPSEQESIRQCHQQIETWENSPMVET